VHSIPDDTWFGRHVPAPLHVSGLSHSVSSGDPHAAPDPTYPLPGQLPAPSQYSVTSQSFTAARHTVVPGARFGRHVPEPLHVSAPLHVVFSVDPHAAPAPAKFAAHDPDPSHVSGSSHDVSAVDPHAVAVVA